MKVSIIRDRFPIFVIFANAVTTFLSHVMVYSVPLGPWIPFLLTGHSIPSSLAQAGLHEILVISFPVQGKVHGHAGNARRKVIKKCQNGKHLSRLTGV